MKQQLIDVLETICPDNVYLQGTLNPEEQYPESFITFFVDDTGDNANFDDDTYSVNWSFSVMYYSSDPSLVNTVPNEIRTKLKAAGFIPQGKGFDLPSDVPTHTGWAMEFKKIEYLL